MKVWTITWGIMAAVCLIAIFAGATHHFMTFCISLTLCMAFQAEDNQDKESHE